MFTTVHRGSPQFAMVRQTAALHHGFLWFATFFHAVLTLSHNKSVFHLALHSRKLFSLTVALRPLSISHSFHEHAVCKKTAFSLHLPPLFTHADPPPHSRVRSYFSSLHSFPACDGRNFAAFAHSRNSTVAFWQCLLNRRIRRTHFGSFPVLRILPCHPCPPVSRTIAFLQLSLTLSIRRSRFCNFCSIAAFDSRILAAFLLCHAGPAPRSRERSHFCSFRSLSVFDGRVLATFAQLQHSSVAF